MANSGLPTVAVGRCAAAHGGLAREVSNLVWLVPHELEQRRGVRTPRRRHSSEGQPG